MNDPKDSSPSGNGQPIKTTASKWDPEREPVEELAAEFADRRRRGDHVSVEEYARLYPQFATEIRDLFPTVLAMESLNHSRRVDPGLTSVDASVPIERFGDFRVIGEIARGGMGIVYEAEQVSLGRRVAVKVLPKQALRSERDVKRFQREAHTAANLHHTNIVPVFGVGEQDGTHYIVMQLIHGVGLDEILGELKQIVINRRDEQHGSSVAESRSSRVKRSATALLRDELQRESNPSSVNGGDENLGSLNSGPNGKTGSSNSNDQDGEPNPVPRATGNGAARRHNSFGIGPEYYRNVARIGLQAASALSYAHRHATLHRDVKPGNLLLDDEGVVWIADFGLAKAIEQNNVTWTGDIVGTLGYMAPERFEGRTSALSDIYSLGLTLYELLTFERAFDGTDRVLLMHRVTREDVAAPRKRNPDIPRDLETIVLKAAARNPSDRYQTAEGIVEDLECFMQDRPIRARRIGQTEQFVRWCRRNRTVASLAATALFLLATVCCVTMIGYFRETAQRQRAEATSRLAVKALDEIYGQFAPTQLNVTVLTSLEEDDEEALAGHAQLPLSKDVALLLENLLTFYDDLSKQSDDTESVVIKSISANRRVGDIQRRLGDIDKAQVAYERAIHRIQHLDDSLRNTANVRLESARVQNGLGIILEERGLNDEVIKAHRLAIEHLDQASESATERSELARTLYLLHLAQHKAARERRQSRRKPRRVDDGNIRRAIAILNELCQAYPNVHDYRYLLARCFLATRSEDRHREGGLSEWQIKALDILEELVESSPDVPDYRYELGDAYASIEWQRIWRRRDEQRSPAALAESESRLRRALEVTEDLETNHPNIPQYNMLKKRLHHILASVLEDAGRRDEAKQQYELAIEKQRLVIRQAREPRHHMVWDYHLRLSHAQLLRDLGMNDEARERLEANASGLEELLTLPEITENGFSRRVTEKTLARTYVTLSCVLNRIGRSEEAETILRKAEDPRP